MSTGYITQRGTGRPRGRRRPAFTLIELLTVMVIIAILLSAILIAAVGAQRRAEERATQTLIVKLDSGIADRLDALLQTQPSANYAHGYLASIYYAPFTSYAASGAIPPPYLLNSSGQPVLVNGQPALNSQVRTSLRAQAIALYDYLKAELPDVFSLDPKFSPGASYSGPYPFHFAGAPFPGTDVSGTGYGNVMLPLGHMVANTPPSSHGDGGVTFPNLGLTGSGIFGASYNSAAGLYRNLGYGPLGYDGVDNGGISGLVDDWQEGMIGLSPQQAAQVQTNLGNHQHKTARAEMLYAILVEGSGPWGSVFRKDEFTDREVRDTDGDGLPEFIDAWGQPLQFFRWPLFYHSSFQIGMNQTGAGGSAWDLAAPYGSTWQERERDPFDPTNQLTAPGWWSAGTNGNSPFASPSGALSGGAVAFASFFHTLAEPLQVSATTPLGQGLFWDPSPGGARRAFYTKPLILSAGLDQAPGVFLYSDPRIQALGQKAALGLIANENNAMAFGLDLIDFTQAGQIPFSSPTSPPVISGALYPSSLDPTNPSSFDIQQASQDDISNHNLSTTVGVGGSN